MKSVARENLGVNKMEIRPAREADAEQIVKLIQQSFDTKILNSMIYGCHGIDSYLRQCFSIPESLADTVYMVAEDEDRIAGYIELRLIDKSVFLNYICTHANIRHKGLGRELLLKAIYVIGPSSYDRMSLDVFHNNLVAKSWYEKLGFTNEYVTIWWSIPLAVRGYGLPGKISGIAHANACQREFGFSQFSINTTMASYSVGKLGNDWFRISQEVLLNDDQALATLYQLAPDRKILGLFRENATVNFLEDWKPFCRSVRMTTNLEPLLANLSN